MSIYWVYILAESDPEPLWTVGYVSADGRWIAESDWGTEEEAAARVRTLREGRS